MSRLIRMDQTGHTTLAEWTADDPSAVGGDQRVDGAAKVTERSMRARFVLAHQAAETDHIRMQNGGKFPVPTTEFHDLLSHWSPEN